MIEIQLLFFKTYFFRSELIWNASSFVLETGFDIEDMLVDVFHWFDKSSKRKNTLEELCTFIKQEYKT